MELEFDVVIDANAIYDSRLHRSFGGSNGVLAETAGALCIVIYALRGGWPLLILGLLLMIAPPVLLYWLSKQEAARLENGGRMHYRLTQEGICWSKGGTADAENGAPAPESCLIPWESIQKAESTTKNLLLTVDKKQVLIFPRKDLGDSLTKGIEMISTHMEPERVNIRL